MKYILLTVIIFNIISCCKQKEDIAVCKAGKLSPLILDTNYANIRLKNNSGIDFCEIAFDEKGTLSDQTSPTATYFGSLKNNSFTSYNYYKQVFIYGWVKAITIDDSIYVKPIDYISEVPLDKGKYTFILSKGINNSLRLEAVKDK